MRKLSISGPAKNRVNLVFFGDGCVCPPPSLPFSQIGYALSYIYYQADTPSEEEKFFEDAQSLTDDVVRPEGAFGLVKPLLNIWAVYVPSNEVSHILDL